MRNIENKKDILSDEKNVLRKAVSQKKSCVNGETAGVFNAVSESAMHDNMLYRFRARQGHGYAAEQGNDLIDKINLRDARILGNDNKSGDRTGWSTGRGFRPSIVKMRGLP